jgi:hypothetical protein
MKISEAVEYAHRMISHEKDEAACKVVSGIVLALRQTGHRNRIVMVLDSCLVVEGNMLW